MGGDGDGDDGGSGGDEVKNDIKAVTKAFQLDEVNSSQQNFLSILEYGKDLYCKGDTMLLEQWPTTWQGSLRLLERNGYKEPKNVCLDDNHPCNYSIVYDPEDECQYCNTKDSSCIKYSYIWQIK